MDGSTPRGVVTVERLAVWLLAALVVIGAAALVVGPGAELRTATPNVEIDGSYDAATSSVTVTHAGGDRLTATATSAVAVVVTDADRNATTRLTWATESQGLPIGPGDSFTVDDTSIDSNSDGDYLDADGSVGFHLADGDTVAVVWTGRIVGAPNERTTTLGSVTVETTT